MGFPKLLMPEWFVNGISDEAWQCESHTRRT